MLDQILDILLYVPRAIYAAVVDGAASLIASIPLPQGLVLNPVLDPTILYYLDVFNVDVGLTIIFGSLTARFFLRRIPIVG